GLTGAFFLSSRAAPEPVAGLTWARVRALAPSAITRAAPVITLAPQATWIPDLFALPLYGGDDESIAVARLHVGAGEALWWASATPLTNAGLRETGNLDFFLASVGPPDRRRVLFDEYFHGDRPTLAGSLVHSPIKWLGLQLCVVAVAIL